MGITTDCLGYSIDGCAYFSRTTVANCTLYNINDDCVACAQGFALNGAVCLSSTDPTNCRFLGTDGTCVVCQSPSYYPVAGQANCTQAAGPIANCLARNATACVACEPGFFPNDAGQCVQLQPDHCTAYNTDLTCKVCDNTTYADANGLCTPLTTLIANCLTYDAPGKCRSCVAPFGVSDDQSSCGALTKIVDPNCLVQLSNGVCIFCKDGYYTLTTATNLLCRPMVNGDKCFFRSKNGICSGCVVGYYVNIEGNCESVGDPLIPFCDTFANATACATCETGYFLASPTNCTLATPLSGCLSYASNTTCAACDTAAGWALATTSRVCVGNCTTAGATGCAQCASGFFPSAGVCTPVTAVIANCLAYSSATACSLCDYGFTLLSNNTCAANGDATCSGSSRTRCLICDKDSFLSAGQCAAVPAKISGCVVYGAGGTSCEQCQPNYALTAARKCALRGSVSPQMRSLAGCWFD